MTGHKFAARLSALVVAAGLIAPVLTTPAADASTAATSAAQARKKPSPTAPVTWLGWRGVKLGTKLTKAHRRLGGRLEKVGAGGGCGDVLTTRTGVLDGDGYKKPHRVGTIIASTSAVTYPLGIRNNMSPDTVKAAIARAHYTLHQKIVLDNWGNNTYEDWVIGPRGHAFYFLYDSTNTIDRMGMAIGPRVAIVQMEMNGC